ncbi:NAD(P)-binding protein [Coniochaeta ligniaria NRRL 30616]|uniref:NAD(P)-binding protein n=1 Tax=Coniochaeta ligniaria NRRL 30616 TaxID=1408157 RepID=A0A1J7JP94_9PEZI|nr:NAD(P)-binding protein [Coniochaeta ligniaria NRRL 30616]
MSSKVIIVTGASRGIGLAITKWLIKNQHKVVIVSRSEAALKAIKDESPSQVAYLAADLTDLEVATKVTDLAVKTFGRLDGLVVNHGILTPIKRIADSTVEEWKRIYDANFFSALVKAAIPPLRETKGRIVFTSSGAALHGYSAWGPYGSSKAAMNSLAQHIAVEEPLIATVSVGPGRVDTDMQKEIRETGKAMDGETHKDFVAVFETGALLKPEQPGHVIAKLAVEAKTDLNGEYYNWNSTQLAPYREDA